MTERITEGLHGIFIVEHIEEPQPSTPNGLRCQLCDAVAVGFGRESTIFGYSFGNPRWEIHRWACKCKSVTVTCPACNAAPWETRTQNGGPWPRCPTCNCEIEYT